MRMRLVDIQRLLLPTLDHTLFFFFWNSAKCDPAGSEKHIFKLVWPNLPLLYIRDDFTPVATTGTEVV